MYKTEPQIVYSYSTRPLGQMPLIPRELLELAEKPVWIATLMLGTNMAYAAAADLLLGMVWWLLIPFVPAILILLLRGWEGLREFREGIRKLPAPPKPWESRKKTTERNPTSVPASATGEGLSNPNLTFTRERNPTRPLAPKTKTPTLQLPPKQPNRSSKLTDTGIFISKNPTATLERWGRGELILSGRNPVTFSLGGLERMDLGQRLSISALLDFVVILTRGGLRIVRLPEGLEVFNPNLLQPGDTISFGSTLELKGNVSGEIMVVGLEGVPIPGAILDYTGARPEQYRSSLALFGELELGKQIFDPTIGRLRMAPVQEGIQITHIPGNLSVGIASKPHLEAGSVVPHGESLYLRDVSSRAGLGIIDVCKP